MNHLAVWSLENYLSRTGLSIGMIPALTSLLDLQLFNKWLSALMI